MLIYKYFYYDLKKRYKHGDLKFINITMTIKIMRKIINSTNKSRLVLLGTQKRMVVVVFFCVSK